MKSISRIDFFRELGLNAGASLADSLDNLFNGISNDQKLTEEKKQLLLEYQEWLIHFHAFVIKRNQNPLDINNNKRLMELSVEAEKRKPTLEKYMKDPQFAQHFIRVTDEITQVINS